ncbi:gamma-glutamylcyclotransferase [Vibrio neptunius]|uniref:gamma-glutamylcyclotransferase family protein n=1 Tax=Vibrio neptunius TaxID=170651 RepID=UPI003314FE60
MQHLLFVYGTLRQGESNHNYLVGSQCLGHFETLPNYALYDLGAYPAVIEGHGSILGEVYLIDGETLSKVDQLEDVPIEYRREQIETPFGEAWIYLYQDGSKLDTIISSGDWCQRV